MGIREQLVQARKAAGLSQEELAKRARWDRAQVSKFESGDRGASVDKIDAWLEACGVDLVVVASALQGDQVHGLGVEQRDLLRRLAALLPRLTEDRADTILGLVERWEEVPDRTLLAADPAAADYDASPIAQDKRASSS